MGRKKESPLSDFEPVSDSVEIVTQNEEVKENRAMLEKAVLESRGPISIIYQGGAEDRASLPPPWSPDRTPFLMGKLTDEEKFNDRPRHNGLRRLIYGYIGKIVGSDPHYLNAYCNDMRSACSVRVTVREYDTGEVIEMSGTADCNEINTPQNFQPYAVASVETMARSRAFKEILAMSVLTAEEGVGIEKVDEYYNQRAGKDMLFILDNLMKRANVSPHKFLKQAMQNHKISRLGEMTIGQGRAITKDLNDIVRNVITVEDSLKGYKAGWIPEND
jgi:hypothetical protein